MKYIFNTLNIIYIFGQISEIIQQMVLIKLITICRKMKLDSYLSSSIKLNSKWIKDINIKSDTESDRDKTTLDTGRTFQTGSQWCRH